MPNVKATEGEFIEITSRRCGGLQPSITIGSRWHVKQSTRTPTGIETLVCDCPGAKRKSVRINSSRFGWRVLTERDIIEEDSKQEADEINRQFTQDEKIRIAIIPLIYAHLAWKYASAAVDLSIQYRAIHLKHISRLVRENQRSYDRFVSRDLDSIHTKTITDSADNFSSLCANDFSIMYFTLSNLMSKHHPDYPMKDLRCTAMMAMNIILMYDKVNMETDELINKRLGRCRRAKRMPQIDALYTCMEAIAGDIGEIDLNDNNLTLCRKIISNKLGQCKFNIL